MAEVDKDNDILFIYRKTETIGYGANARQRSFITYGYGYVMGDLPHGKLRVMHATTKDIYAVAPEHVFTDGHLCREELRKLTGT